MFHPVVADLVKPQWVEVIAALKRGGPLSVADLARELGGGYMTVKAHCEALKKQGYLERTRLPRTAVGRPEILYSLSAKADPVFHEPGTPFLLDLLAEVRHLFGNTAPERLLHQWFQKRADAWKRELGRLPELPERVDRLAELRTKDGWSSRPGRDPLCLIEDHHPLQRVFEAHPTAALIEQRMLEQLLGTRITRREEPGGRNGMPRTILTIG